MELDKRIKEGKRPLTCFDIEEAKAFIGKECYLSNNMGCFSDLNCGVENKEIKKAELTNISNSAPCYEIPGFYYDFCLPCEWVKPEESEKKYRPYTLAEWIDQHEIGEVIHFRNKDNQEFNVMYTGYVIEHGEDVEDIRTTGRIMLINMGYSLESLFNDNYEICINGEWQPFGVIEDD